jgi:DNA-binding GntR family transcriptional regulator
MTLSNRVAAQIREQIVSGVLPEGAPLLQEKLADDFKVSRIPVREAMKQLEAEGLITSYPHRTSVVAKTPISQIVEIFELRVLIECDLLRRALPNIPDDYLAKADQIARVFYNPDGESSRDWAELNWQFHSTLYQAANRPLTLEVLQHLHQREARFLRLHMQLTHGVERAGQDHRRIVELCLLRDTEGAVSFLREHISETGIELISKLQKTHDDHSASLTSSSIAEALTG